MIFTLPNYYFGTRTYHPQLIRDGSIYLILSSGLMFYAAYRAFGLNGLLLPGVYFDLVIGIIIYLGNCKNTFQFRLIDRIIKKTREIYNKN